jgi:hypothetical protein
MRHPPVPQESLGSQPGPSTAAEERRSKDASIKQTGHAGSMTTPAESSRLRESNSLPTATLETNAKRGTTLSTNRRFLRNPDPRKVRFINDDGFWRALKSSSIELSCPPIRKQCFQNSGLRDVADPPLSPPFVHQSTIFFDRVRCMLRAGVALSGAIHAQFASAIAVTEQRPTSTNSWSGSGTLHLLDTKRPSACKIGLGPAIQHETRRTTTTKAVARLDCLIFL